MYMCLRKVRVLTFDYSFRPIGINEALPMFTRHFSRMEKGGGEGKEEGEEGEEKEEGGKKEKERKKGGKRRRNNNRTNRLGAFEEPGEGGGRLIVSSKAPAPNTLCDSRKDLRFRKVRVVKAI
uniref:Uncharacterized protein n=1 Tax=Globodera rostochiensis TaxID=31243 RepID=A0A914HCN1_GLORO